MAAIQPTAGGGEIGGDGGSDRQICPDSDIPTHQEEDKPSYGPKNSGSIMEYTELIKMPHEKHKYVNTRFTKVQAKMYDYNCDVKLKVDKETFRAHRDVLSEASDYFSAMFGHDMLEKGADAIEMHGISPEGFTAMLEYFYHGHVTIVPSNIEDIIEASRFFMIEWMLKVCCDFLIRHLSLENYDNVLTLADKYVLGDLRFSIFRFIGNNFQTLAEQKKFLHLSYELFYLLLAEDYCIEATEAYIFHTVLDWIHHEPEEREKYLVEMLILIRFPLFEPEELEHIPDEVLRVPELKELVDEALDYHANPQLQCLLSTDSTVNRGAQDVVMAISVIEDADLIQYKQPSLSGFFNEEANTSFLDSVFEFAQVAMLGNFMFVAGGYDRSSWCSSSAFYRYNPRTRAWGELAPMIQPRVSFSLVAATEGLYAVAGIDHIVEEGHDTENILSTAEYYDPKSGVWSSIPELPHGCFSMAGAFCRNTLFISGGINDDPEDTVPVNYNRSYVPGQHTWVLMSPMLTERQGHSMTALHDKLYALGGYHSGQDTMSFSHCLKAEVYDVELNQWTQLRDLNPTLEHVHASTAILNDKIYVLGGRHSSRFLGAYNTETNEVEQVEYCGEHVLKLATVTLAFPMSLDRELVSEATEEVKF